MSTSAWTEHRHADGRLYWYHSGTQQSVWEKPAELRTPEELAFEECGWKRYFQGTRPYFVNQSNNQTVWELPIEVRDQVDKAAIAIAASRPPPALPAGPSAASNGAASPSIPTGPAAASLPFRPGANGMSPGGGANTPNAAGTSSSMALVAPGQFGKGGSTGSPYPGVPTGPAAMASSHVDLDFKTKEEAEAAFMDMLRAEGVTTSWTWEQVMRNLITNPYFKALRTLSERKAAFEKYVEDIKRQQREAKERSMERNRPAWRTALGRLSEGDYGMKSWWSWERASKEIKERMPDVWSMSRQDDERESLWREYMTELSQKEAKRQQEVRQSNIEKMAGVLKGLNLDLSVRYHDASIAVRSSKDWQDDPELQSIEPLDFLIVFEESVKRNEQEHQTLRLEERTQRARQIRKDREAYVSMLESLKTDGTIKAGSKWKDIFPLLQDDERFLNMLPHPGSNPMELFWDIVDGMDSKIEEDTRIVENVMAEKGVTVDAKTDFDEWQKQLEQHIRFKSMKGDERKAVFQALQDRLAALAREEQRRLERKLRHQADDLRYAMKTLDSPAISLTSTYEDILPQMQELPEYKDLEGHDDARRAAFDKYLKRLAERLQEEKEEAEEEEKRRQEKARRAEEEDRLAMAASAAAAHSDTESHASTHRRRRSEKERSGRRATPSSPARSSHANLRERESDARSPSRHDRRSGTSKEPSSRPSAPRERERESRYSAAVEDEDDKDRRSSYRRSSRRDEDRERGREAPRESRRERSRERRAIEPEDRSREQERDSRRRSSRRDAEDEHRSASGSYEVGRRDRHERREGNEKRSSTTRRRDARAEDESKTANGKADDERDAKRQKVDDDDKEEGEI